MQSSFLVVLISAYIVAAQHCYDAEIDWGNVVQVSKVWPNLSLLTIADNNHSSGCCEPNSQPQDLSCGQTSLAVFG